jgi:uncharacterized protein YbjT (DUF2867 family)
MKVFVTAGTGTVGTPLTRELVARGHEVTVLTRSADKVAALPEGVRGVVGDLLDVPLLRTEFAAVDAVFLNLPVDVAETYQGLLAVDAARRAEVGRLVYHSVHDLENFATTPFHGAKLAIEHAVRGSGIPYTIVRSNSFMQNDLLAKDPIIAGDYGIPLGGIGVSRIDVRDVAEAAAIVLTTDGHLGQTYPLAGPDALTGELTAATWSGLLGVPVRYAAEQAADFINQFLPPDQARSALMIYERFESTGYTATAEDVERLTKLLGRPPRTFVDFATETAREWTS